MHDDSVCSGGCVYKPQQVVMMPSSGKAVTGNARGDHLRSHSPPVHYI